MDLHFKLRRFIGCALLLLAAATVHAQERTRNVFETIPLDSRPRLLERLSEYVTYERTRQYEKLYELLYGRNDKNADKEVYSKSRVETEGRRGVVQEFTPAFVVGVTLNDGDAPTFNLTGQAKVLLKGRTIKKEMSIRARLQDGEWYFSELLGSYSHID